MYMPWVEIMDNMAMIRAQMGIGIGVSKVLEHIAAGYTTGIFHQEYMLYFCERAKKPVPKRSQIVRLVSSSGYNLQERRMIFQDLDDDTSLSINNYVISGGKRDGIEANFAVGIYEFAEFPENVGITHTVHRREGLLELLGEVAKLYQIRSGVRQIPPDDAGLHRGELKTEMPKPFQQYLGELWGI